MNTLKLIIDTLLVSKYIFKSLNKLPTDSNERE